MTKRESEGLKHSNDSKAFIKYLNDTDDISKNIEEYNPIRENYKTNPFWWYDCWYA